nr:copia protein [Tanacetum cinerariifolium]
MKRVGFNLQQGSSKKQRFKNLHIFLLVDTVYLLTPATIKMMLERKLQADQLPISTARQSSSRVAAPVSAARHINTDSSKPLVNVAKTRQNALQITHSLSKRPFYQQTALRNRNLNNNVNAAKSNSINTVKTNFVNTSKGNKSVVGNQGINVVKSSACCVWRPKIKVQDHVSKTSGSYIWCSTRCFKRSRIFDSGCSMHMIENISYLTDFKEYDGGFTWVFFLATKDKTNRIPKSFITEIETLVEKKVKIIRCDNGIEFKNRVMNELCKEKGIKREFSMARTPEKNKAEAFNTACYVQNKVLVVKPHFKTPYELFKCGGREWLFDLDALSKSMNYTPVSACTNSNDFADSHNNDKHGPTQASKSDDQERPNADSSTKTVNTARPINTATPIYANDPLMPDLEDARIFDDAYDDRDEGAEAEYNNLEKFKLLNVWTLVDLPTGKRSIGTKWVYRNKRDQRGIVVRNEARLVAQGYRQEEGIDYNEVFAPLAQIEAIRPDIMFVVCACSRFQVQPKVFHIHAVKRIFRYLKGQPTLGLWYPKDLPLELIAYSNIDYVGASLDRKSTTGGCQFLGSILISWQCKKQTIMGDSTTEAGYIAASNYCG